MALTTESYYVT